MGFTHRPLSSSFLGLPYRILNINHKKELLRGLWVGSRTLGFGVLGSKCRVQSAEDGLRLHPMAVRLTGCKDTVAVRAMLPIMK